MITNYAGIEQAEKDARELKEKYQPMLEYGKTELPEKTLFSRWFVLALMGMLFCLLSVFLAIILLFSALVL